MESETLAGWERNAGALGAMTLRERAALRRRLRYLRKQRELQLRDLGGLVYEMHRLDRQRPDLVQGGIAELAEADDELRRLEDVLGDHRRGYELREAGVGGTCPRCGAYHPSDARFCSVCGDALAGVGPAQ